MKSADRFFWKLLAAVCVWTGLIIILGSFDVGKHHGIVVVGAAFILVGLIAFSEAR